MRNPIFSDSEVESLRAQVRQLRNAVVDLENRLAAFAGEDEENQWGIWPYCYVVASWNFAQRGVQALGTKLGERKPNRRNRHHRLQSENQVAELRLT